MGLGIRVGGLRLRRLSFLEVVGPGVLRAERNADTCIPKRYREVRTVLGQDSEGPCTLLGLYWGYMVDNGRENGNYYYGL